MQNYSYNVQLIYDLVDFLESLMFINVSLPLNILFDDMHRELGQQRNFLLDMVYIFFS